MMGVGPKFVYPKFTDKYFFTTPTYHTFTVLIKNITSFETFIVEQQGWTRRCLGFMKNHQAFQDRISDFIPCLPATRDAPRRGCLP